MRLKLGCAAALTTLAFASLASADSLERANALAQKFSEASEPKPAPTPAPIKPVTNSDARRTVLVQKPVAPSTAVTPQPAKPVRTKTAESAPARPDLDYEIDMLRRARLEEAERKTAGQKAAAPTPPENKFLLIPVDTNVEQHGTTPAHADVKPAQPTVSKPETMKPPAATPAVAPAPPPVAKAEPTPPPAPPAAANAAPLTGPRATILLALDTPPAGAAAKVVPDPIICIDQTCYVSGGFTKAALAMARGDALALKGTEGKSQETCRGQFGCIYRDVAIPADATISVVDLGTGSSSDAGSFSIAADASCKTDEGDLVCGNGLVTHAYRVWTVPEATAKSVGAQVLEDAIADGLVGDDVASTNDK